MLDNRVLKGNAQVTLCTIVRTCNWKVCLNNYCIRHYQQGYFRQQAYHMIRASCVPDQYINYSFYRWAFSIRNKSCNHQPSPSRPVRGIGN